MRRRPGYLRIAAAVFHRMFRWALSSDHFIWVAAGAPIAAWLLSGNGEIPVMPFAVSAVAWCLPAAFIAGWRVSEDRRWLAGLLFGSRAGRASLVVPEMLLPLLAGCLPAIILVSVAPPAAAGVPWQLWTVTVFSPLTALSAIVLLERYLGRIGYIVALAGFMAQASAASWAGSGVFQFMVPQGYVLWTMRWVQDSGAAFHGDIYAFFSVLEGIGLSILAFRVLLED